MSSVRIWWSTARKRKFFMSILESCHSSGITWFSYAHSSSRILAPGIVLKMTGIHLRKTWLYQKWNWLSWMAYWRNGKQVRLKRWVLLRFDKNEVICLISEASSTVIISRHLDSRSCEDCISISANANSAHIEERMRKSFLKCWWKGLDQENLFVGRWCIPDCCRQCIYLDTWGWKVPSNCVLL